MGKNVYFVYVFDNETNSLFSKIYFSIFLCAFGSSIVIKCVKSGKKKMSGHSCFLFFLKNSCENDYERIHLWYQQSKERKKRRKNVFTVASVSLNVCGRFDSTEYYCKPERFYKHLISPLNVWQGNSNSQIELQPPFYCSGEATEQRRWMPL